MPVIAEYRALEYHWQVLEQHLTDVKSRFDQNCLIQPPDWFIRELHMVYGGLNKIKASMLRGDLCKRPNCGSASRGLAEVVANLSEDLIVFTSEAQNNHGIFVYDMVHGASEPEAGLVRPLRRDYRKLIKDYRRNMENFRASSKPGVVTHALTLTSTSTSTRNPTSTSSCTPTSTAGPEPMSNTEKTTARLLLVIYKGLIDYWVAWTYFFNVPRYARDDKEADDEEDEPPWPKEVIEGESDDESDDDEDEDEDDESDDDEEEDQREYDRRRGHR